MNSQTPYTYLDVAWFEALWVSENWWERVPDEHKLELATRPDFLPADERVQSVAQALSPHKDARSFIVLTQHWTSKAMSTLTEEIDWDGRERTLLFDWEWLSLRNNSVHEIPRNSISEYKWEEWINQKFLTLIEKVWPFLEAWHNAIFRNISADEYWTKMVEWVQDMQDYFWVLSRYEASINPIQGKVKQVLGLETEKTEKIRMFVQDFWVTDNMMNEWWWKVISEVAESEWITLSPEEIQSLASFVWYKNFTYRMWQTQEEFEREKEFLSRL